MATDQVMEFNGDKETNGDGAADETGEDSDEIGEDPDETGEDPDETGEDPHDMDQGDLAVETKDAPNDKRTLGMFILLATCTMGRWLSNIITARSQSS
jgi:hypothetical protein